MNHGDDENNESDDDDTESDDNEPSDEDEIDENSDCDNENVDVLMCNHGSNHNCNCQSSNANNVVANDRLSLSEIGNKLRQKVSKFLPTEPHQTSWAKTQPQTVCTVYNTFIHYDTLVHIHRL